MMPKHTFYRVSRRTALGWMAATPMVLAQSASQRPIRLIVAFSPGSINDRMARELARPMGELLDQTIVVENRPGAGGSIGTDAVAKAKPDGLTIGLGTSSQLVMNVALYTNLPFDVERDLRMIGLVTRSSMVLVGRADGPRSIAQLRAQAQAQPGQISYGSAGTGSISHIVGEAFARALDIKLNHVPYKGNAAAMADLAGGHVDLVFDGMTNSRPLAQQGRARLLAFSSKTRHPDMPDVPTFVEQGLADYDAYSWNCLMAPSGVADDVLMRLNRALNAALATPDMRNSMAQTGVENLGPSTPAAAQFFGRAQRARWVPFVRGLGIG